MSINYKEIAARAVTYAKKNNITLDFSRASIEQVDFILQCYYEHLAEYDGEEGADTLWNIAVHFGVYLGETLLQNRLRDKGYAWHIEEGLPVLWKDERNTMSPITKAHKRILNGPSDSLESFYDVALSIADGGFPTKNVHRGVDVQLPSGQVLENVLFRDIDSYIMCIENGEEDFLILKSHDGFLQFYGISNQFVAEIRINLKDNDFRTYSVINKDKEYLTERISLTTPYGQFTPTAREVVSLELIKTVVRKYYENVDTDNFLKEIPCVETTEEMKRCMGLL